MANPSAPTLDTTLAAAVAKDDRTISLTSVTGLVVNSRLVVGREIMHVLAINSTFAEVRRGTAGTAAVAHSSGAAAYGGAQAEFGIDKDGVYVAGYTGSLGEHARMRLPLTTIYRDPDTGYEYRLCKAAAALLANDWVQISEAGVATETPASEALVPSKIGIAIEDVLAADDLCWILVSGAYATANAGTVSAEVILGFSLAAGRIEAWAATKGMQCFGAGNTAAASGNLMAVVLNHPFVDGFVSV